jgi:hypothetical protein
MRSSVNCLLLIALFFAPAVFAEDPPSIPQSATTFCTFEDGNSLTVRYSNTPRKGDLPNGKVWSPGDVPMLLFTEVPVKVVNTDLPVGAYSMFVIPGKDKWTLILNRNVNANAAYDEKQDILRTSMDVGRLPTPTDQPQVSFAHIGPKVCSLRVDHGKVGVWADVFVQK